MNESERLELAEEKINKLIRSHLAIIDHLNKVNKAQSQKIKILSKDYSTVLYQLSGLAGRIERLEEEASKQENAPG